MAQWRPRSTTHPGNTTTLTNRAGAYGLRQRRRPRRCQRTRRAAAKSISHERERRIRHHAAWIQLSLEQGEAGPAVDGLETTRPSQTPRSSNAGGGGLGVGVADPVAGGWGGGIRCQRLEKSMARPAARVKHGDHDMARASRRGSAEGRWQGGRWGRRRRC
jgi:hypothetical protein